MKKYIVNDLSNQTLTGNLRIDGGLLVTDGTYSISTYRALLTHAGVFSGTNLVAFNYALIVGETYTITSYNAGDDFSNIGQVVSGVMNTTGCEFIATGEIPLVWNNASILESAGNLIVDVIENNIGYDIGWWEFMPGVYIGTKIYDGYLNGGLFNDWPRRETSVIITQSSQVLYAPPIGPVIQFAGPSSWTTKDDSLVIINWNYDTYESVSNWLYNTPIEIKIRQNLDTTPIVVYGSIGPSFPFGQVAFDFYDDSTVYIDSFYTGDGNQVNNMEELIIRLNTNTNTNFLGTYADNGDGLVALTMATNLRNQLSPSENLTFAIYAD